VLTLQIQYVVGLQAWTDSYVTAFTDYDQNVDFRIVWEQTPQHTRRIHLPCTVYSLNYLYIAYFLVDIRIV
jgi:hypothetical protein